MQGKSAGLMALMMLAVMVAIAAITWLVFGFTGHEHAGEFWLSFVMVEVGVLVGFGYPLLLTVRGGRSRQNLPLHFVPMLLIWGYMGGCVVLALIAMIPGNQLTGIAVGHIILGLVLLLGLGGIGLAAIFFGGMDAKDKRERVPVLLLTNRCAGIRDRLNLVEADVVKPLAADFGTFCAEDLTHATGNSVAGAEAVDAELNSCLDELENQVELLEQPVETPPAAPAAAGDGEGGGDSEAQAPAEAPDAVQEGGRPGPHAAAVAEAERLVKRLRQILKRREDLIAELRRA